jgi:hypothetical protein
MKARDARAGAAGQSCSVLCETRYGLSCKAPGAALLPASLPTPFLVPGAWRFAGLLTFLDPPRPDTKRTIERALEFGVDVKMITGDHLLIAKVRKKKKERPKPVAGRALRGCSKLRSSSTCSSRRSGRG